jgi:gliding motility-associated-like protein
MKYLFFIVLFVLVMKPPRLYAQQLFHQDVFYGGVTAAGWSGGTGGAGNGNIEIYIEPGSTIRNAWLFIYSIGNPSPSFITINGTNIFHQDFIFLEEVDHTGMRPIRHYVYDFSNHIAPTTTNFTVQIHAFSTGPELNWGWFCPVLYVEYDNPSLDKIATSLWYNDKNLYGLENYTFFDMLLIDTDNPVALPLLLDRACVLQTDRTFVEVNGNSLTTPLNGVGGNNLNSSSSCAGVRAHFYYQNNTLYGLDASIANNNMDNNDALADIAPYLSNGDTGYDLKLTHYFALNAGPTAPNVATIFPHAYTTPCDTFSTQVAFSDTATCHGDTIQLGVLGGIGYDWTNPNNMSGASTANPLVWPDSTTLYVVRVENEPGCSRTEQVLVRVNELPEITNMSITPSECGENNGQVNATAVGANPFISDIGFGPQNQAQFPNLSTGTYTLSITDQNGCTADTVVVVPEIISVNASFIATPPSGPEPLAVTLNNTSQNATDYEWYIDADFWDSNTNSSAYFDSTGVYEVMLIAYNNLPECADTAWLTILVQDTLVVHIPNVFSPNGDYSNDVFTIKIRGAEHIKATFLNRWGNEMSYLEQDLTPTLQTLPVWDGITNAQDEASEGVYFYLLEITDVKGEVYSYSGYLHLVR